MVARVLFLCAASSPRALLAASILNGEAPGRWEAWSSPTQDLHGLALAEQVLQEHAIPLIAPDRIISPTFGMPWDEGIILCSGHATT